MEEREGSFLEVTNRIKWLNGVEGIIQIGSGVNGYTDDYSDIDLMIATTEDVSMVKEKIKSQLLEMGAFYIKEGRFSSEIYLLIPFFNNGLEMNISVLPVNLLSVKSPLWKVIYDVNGIVLLKMQQEMNGFEMNHNPYRIRTDVVFQYAYHLRKLKIELKRNNFIYALKMLEQLGEFTLELQAVNEGKKLHQFKAYHKLNPAFIEKFLLTYPSQITEQQLVSCMEQLTHVFKTVVQESKLVEWEEEIFQIANV